MRACGSCGRSLRKGTARKAWCVGEAGFALRVVCARCALGSIVVCVPAPVQVGKLCSECKKEHATVCAACHSRATSFARELLAANMLLKAVQKPK